VVVVAGVVVVGVVPFGVTGVRASNHF